MHVYTWDSNIRRSLMSLHIAKLFSRPLALASAALVIHIGAATAADSTGDIQQQMRELLAGTTRAHSASQSGLRDGKATSPTVDPQEFVKQLLLGVPGRLRIGQPLFAALRVRLRCRPVLSTARNDARELPQCRRAAGSPDERSHAGPRNLVGWL